MRVVSGIVALVVGIAALLGAVGLQTVWAPPVMLTATVPEAPAEAPLTVITADIDEVDEDPVEFTLTGEGSFNVMLGRDRDVAAWVGDAAHNTVTGIAPGIDAGQSPRIVVEHSEGEATVPNPRDSDLWLDVQTVEDRLDQRWSVPSDGDWALLVARDGTEPAPADLTVTWTNRTGDIPWIVPLYVTGSLLVLAGIALLAWALIRRRGTRGGAGGTASDTTGGRRRAVTPATGGGSSVATRQVRPGRPAHAARGVGAGLAVLALGMTGPAPVSASPTAPPAGPGAAAQSPAQEPGQETAEESAPEQTDGEDAYPVLTDVQLERILTAVSETVRAADGEQDAGLLEPRVTAHAQEIRAANYRNRQVEESVSALEPIAAGPVLSAVAVSDPAFPRTAMAVTEGEGNSTPQLLLLRQDSPRSQYRLIANAPMVPGAELPGGSLDQTGVEVVAEDGGEGLVAPPWQALTGTAEYLVDDEADAASRIASNPYVDAIHEYQDQIVADAEDADFNFHRDAQEATMVTLRLADGSALAFGHLDARTIVQPKEQGGTVIVDELVAGLGGGAQETGGRTRMTYRETVALHIPAEGAEGNDALVSIVGMGDQLREVKFLRRGS